MAEQEKLFMITADYRKNNPNKPIYFVVVSNSRQAKERFKKRITWLDIYDIREITEKDRIEEITGNPYKYICLK